MVPATEPSLSSQPFGSKETSVWPYTLEAMPFSVAINNFYENASIHFENSQLEDLSQYIKEEMLRHRSLEDDIRFPWVQVILPLHLVRMSSPETFDSIESVFSRPRILLQPHEPSRSSNLLCSRKDQTIPSLQ